MLSASSPTPLGFDAADLIAIMAIVTTIFLTLITAIGVLVLRTLTRMDERVDEVRDDAATAVRELRRDLASDFSVIWRAIRSPQSAAAVGPPTQTGEGAS